MGAFGPFGVFEDGGFWFFLGLWSWGLLGLLVALELGGFWAFWGLWSWVGFGRFGGF